MFCALKGATRMPSGPATGTGLPPRRSCPRPPPKKSRPPATRPSLKATVSGPAPPVLLSLVWASQAPEAGRARRSPAGGRSRRPGRARRLDSLQPRPRGTYGARFIGPPNPIRLTCPRACVRPIWLPRGRDLATRAPVGVLLLTPWSTVESSLFLPKTPVCRSHRTAPSSQNQRAGDSLPAPRRGGKDPSSH